MSEMEVKIYNIEYNYEGWSFNFTTNFTVKVNEKEIKIYMDGYATHGGISDIHCSVTCSGSITFEELQAIVREVYRKEDYINAVSYTHLTLPTTERG